MRFVTLISDWNAADYYIGAIKGRILGNSADCMVVDVNHQITSHNINQAAFILKQTYRNFPKGTIHLVAVQSEASKNKPILLVNYDEHYFVSADNGLFFLFMDHEPEQVIAIEPPDHPGSFPELEVFALVAIALLNGKNPEEFGEKRDKVFKQLPVLPAVEENVLVGKVIYIDSYQNIITNIDRQTFDRTGNGRPFVIYVQSKGNRITRLNKSYNETAEGELLALFNHAGYLEIAIRNGRAAELFNLTTTSAVRIIFEDKKEKSNSGQQTLF